MFTGAIRCIECRGEWGTTWNTQAPVILCHECGGQCIPVGPQLDVRVVPSAIDGEMFRLDQRTRRRVAS